MSGDSTSLPTINPSWLIPSHEISGETGNKALSLAKMLSHGISVPPFYITSPLFFRHWISDNNASNNLASEVHQKMKCAMYAVRSNSFLEDEDTSSMAGRFRTELMVPPGKISQAIDEVFNDALGKMNDPSASFSLIIQEYVAPDIFGVTFTRHPLKGRQMVIEYHQGSGNSLVGGEITPERLEVYWNDILTTTTPPWLHGARIIFKNVEELFSKPQDIEWCISGSQIHILQSRTITTLLPEQIEENILLDNQLPSSGSFYYYKNEICEAVPRPTTFNLDILRALQVNGGPCHRVYQKYGIRYNSSPSLVVLGNELFVDKHAEFNSLYPGSFPSTAGTSPLRKITNFYKTVSNQWKTGKIAHQIQREQMASLKSSMQDTWTKATKLQPSNSITEEFLEIYDVIFEVNFLYRVTLNALESLLKRSDVTIVSILKNRSNFIIPEFYEEAKKWINTLEYSLTGNSLNLLDTSTFSIVNPPNAKEEKLDVWWANLPKWRSETLKPYITNLLELEELREIGRWISVLGTNKIRTAVEHFAKTQRLDDPNIAFFMTLDEFQKESFDATPCLQRRKSYEQFNHLQLEPIISSSVEKPKSELYGVSAGQAEGFLFDLDSLKEDIRINGAPSEHGRILYTQLLKPEIAELFPAINGIVASQGGMLSHLAILAREAKIPVIVNFKPTKSIPIGAFVTLNADTYTVTENLTPH